MIQSQRCWQGVKNQSDILPAPEVGQTEDRHTHTHTLTPLSPQYSPVIKRGQSHAYHFPSWNRKWFLPLRFYLCTFLCHSETHTHTHMFLTVILFKERRYGTSVKPSRGNGTFLPLCSIWHEGCTFLGTENWDVMSSSRTFTKDDSVFAEEIVFLFVSNKIPA